MISIIILTYNSERYIERLLESIIKRYLKEINAKEIEVIVADNSSTDHTLNIANKFKSAVVLMENGGNLGYAKGNNMAVKKAKGDTLLFINPDAEFSSGDIKKLVTHLDTKGIGVVGGEITSFNGVRELSCGKFYNFINILILCLGLEEKFGVRYVPSENKRVDFVSGGFMALKKRVFMENGGFDEHFFMYVEDQDLCYSLKKKGMSTFFSSEATIKHIGQGSSDRSFAIVSIYKGLSYFQKKHMSRLSYVFSVFALKTKALMLIILGKITNNTSLYNTYEKAFQSI